MPSFPSGNRKNWVAMAVGVAFGLCFLLALLNRTTVLASSGVQPEPLAVAPDAPEGRWPPNAAPPKETAPVIPVNRNAPPTSEPGAVQVEGYWWDTRWLGLLVAGVVGFLVVAPALLIALRSPDEDFDPRYKHWAYVALAVLWGGLALVACAHSRAVYVAGFLLAGLASMVGLCLALSAMAPELQQVAAQRQRGTLWARLTPKPALAFWGAALILQQVLPWIIVAELASLEWPGPAAERARKDFWEQVPIPIAFTAVIMLLLLPLFLMKQGRPSLLPRSVLMCMVTASMIVFCTTLLMASLPNTFAPPEDRNYQFKIQYRNRYSGRVTDSTGAAFRGDAFILVFLPSAVGAVVWANVFGGIEWKRRGGDWVPVSSGA